MRPLTSAEKSILIACAAAAVLALFPWYQISFGGDNAPLGELFAGAGGNANAFGSAWGVLAFVACLATIGLVLADRSGALPWQPPARLLAPLVSTGVAIVCMLLYLTAGQSFTAMGVSGGRTLWYWLALAAACWAGWQAFQRWSAGTAGESGDG